MQAWLADQPARAEELLERLRTGDELADQSINPLLCAMLCLVAAEGPVPDDRHDLYAEVVRRLLASTWRGDAPSHDDVDAAEQHLIELAWAGAVDDPATGLGAWPDEIDHPPPADAIRDLVANVADRVDPAPPHARARGRRFLHRTLHEHLAARHLASLPADEVAEALVRRLWFDRDRAEVLGPAVAAHPRPSAVLRRLLELLRARSPSDPFGARGGLDHRHAPGARTDRRRSRHARAAGAGGGAGRDRVRRAGDHHRRGWFDVLQRLG